MMWSIIPFNAQIMTRNLFTYCLEIQKKHEQITRKEEGRAKLSEKLTSIIAEQLQKGIS